MTKEEKERAIAVAQGLDWGAKVHPAYVALTPGEKIRHLASGKRPSQRPEPEP